MWAVEVLCCCSWKGSLLPQVLEPSGCALAGSGTSHFHMRSGKLVNIHMSICQINFSSGGSSESSNIFKSNRTQVSCYSQLSYFHRREGKSCEGCILVEQVDLYLGFA